jgi:hypothetical protein
MSTEVQLTISPRLRDVLPALTDEQRAGLEACILADGRITDPICHWHDGEAEVIVDGMNRFEIATKHGLPYPTERMEFADYQAASLWMLERQLKRRNVTPQQAAELRGRWYNTVKQDKLGNLKRGASVPEVSNDISGKHKGKVTLDPSKVAAFPDSQIAHFEQANPTTPAEGQTTAEVIAKKSGVSPATVHRDAKRDEAIRSLPEAIRNGIHAALWKAPQDALAKFVKLDPGSQQVAARAVRTGQAATLKDAMKGMGVPGAKPKANGKETPTAPKLVDELSRAHIGPVARGLTAIAKANGGEGKQFHAADDGLNAVIAALKEMRKGLK